MSDAVAASILKSISPGLALFGLDDLEMRWCNANFRKQTWLGGATGGKSATKVLLLDLFNSKDHSAVLELVRIANTLGQSYDFSRMIRRGPVGSFPAELKFHKQNGIEEQGYVCMEISDLSLNRLYDELQTAHGSLRESMADLMSAEAELQYSVRMNTISEMGAEIAHQLINPVTMCRDILENRLLPKIENQDAALEIQNALRHVKSMEDLGVWFRKFSNPRLSEIQVCRVMRVIDDACALHKNRFEKLGIKVVINKSSRFDASVLMTPLTFMMWINAAFTELANAISNKNLLIIVDISEVNKEFSITVHAQCAPHAAQKITQTALEKFARRLSLSTAFESKIKAEFASFSLTLPCFRENRSAADDQKSPPLSKQSSPETAAENRKYQPLILVVDDEPDIRKLLKRAFKNMGVETLEAADGQAALEYFVHPEHAPLAERIGFIVCDVRMPHLSGPHFLLALHDANVELPFVFFSSNLIDPDQSQDFSGDHVHYLTKEAGLEELKTLVARYIIKAPI